MGLALEACVWYEACAGCVLGLRKPRKACTCGSHSWLTIVVCFARDLACGDEVCVRVCCVCAMLRVNQVACAYLWCRKIS